MDSDDPWSAILARLGKRVPAATPSGTPPWPVYADLAARMAAGPVVIAQIGQSLDGRIATESGHSHYVNGAESLDHLHRLRAMVDAVVVGASTATLDNPRLTTRRVPGPNPVRVLIDPTLRVPTDRALLAEDDAPTVILTAVQPATPDSYPAHCRIVPLDAPGGRIDPAAVLATLRGLGLGHLLIEGGGRTISGFLAAGLLDRLHVSVAPLLMGSGRPGIALPPIDTLGQALRFETKTYPLGEDTLFDCRLR